MTKCDVNIELANIFSEKLTDFLKEKLENKIIKIGFPPSEFFIEDFGIFKKDKVGEISVERIKNFKGIDYEDFKSQMNSDDRKHFLAKNLFSDDFLKQVIREIEEYLKNKKFNTIYFLKPENSNYYPYHPFIYNKDNVYFELWGGDRFGVGYSLIFGMNIYLI